MIIQENLENGIIRTYSNAGFKVHGGMPEADYDVAYDPEDAHREYTETNIPIDEDFKPKDLSRVKLYRAFKSMGIWDQIKTWMQSQPGMWEEWEYSTTLEKENPLVLNAKEALKTVFELSEEEIEGLLISCEADK